MDILIVMCIGILVGRVSILRRAKKKNGVKRKSVGFVVTGRGIARAEYPVMAEGRRIGTVTTGTYAPTLEKNIGLALVETEFAKVGQEFAIEIRGKNVAAQVIPKPFYKREGQKV